MYYGFKPYVPVAERQAQARRELAALAKKGRPLAPIRIEGRTIASSFWGKAWCDNLESYGDYENRLPRGRTYVRNGSVMDLQIGAGKVTARVAGSELYTVDVSIRPIAKARWRAIIDECAGRIDSVVELLGGRFSDAVMQVLARRKAGLFPEPREIEFQCSCPDWASMCKHVAAALYGVGARLDAQPELFFTLRQVDQLELITQAGAASALGKGAPGKGKALTSAAGLSSLFGIEMDDEGVGDVGDMGGVRGDEKPKAAAKSEAKAKTKTKTVAKAKPKTAAKAQTKAKPKARANARSRSALP